MLLLPPPLGAGGPEPDGTVDADFVILPGTAQTNAAGTTGATGATGPRGIPAVVGRANKPAAKPTQQRPGHDTTPFDLVPADDGAALTKGLRRRWLSAGFKRSQHTILLVRLSGDAAEGRRVSKALGAAMAPLGDVYAFGPMGRALIAPDKPVRHVVKIAQSLRSAVMSAGGQSVLLSAGVALIHRDDDTTYTLCTAERNLREAEAAPQGGVVTGADVMAPGREAGEMTD